jgi:predicted Zn-dependent peptidase
LVLAGTLAPAQVKLPPFEKKTLPNGATMILLRKPEVPLITVRALFRGGSEADPEGKLGVAAITGEMMRRGAAGRTAEQIDAQLDAIGAVFAAGANPQASFVNIEFTARTTDRALDVLAAVLHKPTFPAEEFKKVQSQYADRARSSKDNPRMAMMQYFGPFVYPASHPYARPLFGDENVIGKLTLDDVKAFFSRMYVGRNLILIAAGDLEPASFGPKLAAIGAMLPTGSTFAPTRPAPPKYDSGRLLLVDKPDATQTYFRIAMPGIDRSNPDRVALMLVNTLFGGRFTSMLNDELRVNSGLTYGAASMVEVNRLPGVIAINTYTRTETTVKAIDLALEILGRLRKSGITAEQWASAKNYVKGNFPADQLETADQMASLLGDLEIFGLNRGEVDDLFSKIDSITVDQANAAARKYYIDSNLQFLLIGPAAKIEGDVKKYAPRMKVISIKDPGFVVPSF